MGKRIQPLKPGAKILLQNALNGLFMTSDIKEQTKKEKFKGFKFVKMENKKKDDPNSYAKLFDKGWVLDYAPEKPFEKSGGFRSGTLVTLTGAANKKVFGSNLRDSSDAPPLGEIDWLPAKPASIGKKNGWYLEFSNVCGDYM